MFNNNKLNTQMFTAAAAVAMALPITATAAGTGKFQFVDETNEAGGTLLTDAAPAPWLELATFNWMSYVPDSTPLNEMSIPGTHDTGAMHGGLAVEAQSMTIATQLYAGIRYLDIRTRRTGTSLVIHHAAYYQYLSMDDVLMAVTTFLASHPSETVIMRVKVDEYTPEPGSASFDSIWSNYEREYGSYFAPGLEFGATLGSVRGKIVILRDSWSESQGYAYGDPTKFQIQDSWSVWYLASDPSGGGICIGHKKQLIQTYISMASVLNSKYWFLNHLSGSTGMAPEDVARATNQSAYDDIGVYTGKKVLGTLIMDFPGERMIYRIIKSNFSE